MVYKVYLNEVVLRKKEKEFLETQPPKRHIFLLIIRIGENFSLSLKNLNTLFIL